MKQSGHEQKSKIPAKAPLSLWKSITLIIIFTFGIVGLFGLIIFVITSGAQQIGLSTTGHIVIFVIISGVFAWLVKRLSDTVSGLSHLWFPEEADDQD